MECASPLALWSGLDISPCSEVIRPLGLMRDSHSRMVGGIVCLLALLMTLGAQWYVLQSVAWARMLVQFSRAEPLAEAIEKTFDGKHPCSLCIKIKAGREEEKREQQKNPLAKAEFKPELFIESPELIAPVPDFLSDDAVPFVPHRRFGPSYSPPTPPPRHLVCC
jgi:hypothetical protein